MFALLPRQFSQGLWHSYKLMRPLKLKTKLNYCYLVLFEILLSFYVLALVSGYWTLVQIVLDMYIQLQYYHLWLCG